VHIHAQKCGEKPEQTHGSASGRFLFRVKKTGPVAVSARVGGGVDEKKRSFVVSRREAPVFEPGSVRLPPRERKSLAT
jgi:hypothetical protein